MRIETMKCGPARWYAVCAILAACLFLGGAARPAAAKSVDETSLVVDQDSMTRGEIEEAVQDYFLAQRLKPAKPGTPEFEKAKKEVVDSFIREVLLSEEADREKIEISDAEIDHEVDQQIENMKKNFPSELDFEDGLRKEGLSVDDLKSEIHDKLVRRVKASRALRAKQQEVPASATVPDEDVRAYYAAHPEAYEQVKFAVILFRVPEGKRSNAVYKKQVEQQAQKALAELKGGADFAAYAKKYSEDLGTADKGGEVGQVSRADLDPSLAKGVFAIPKDGLGIVRAVDGFYIVKVEYKGSAGFASAAPEIKDHLQKERQQSSMKVWIDGLRQAATITMDGKAVEYTPSQEAAAPKAKAAEEVPVPEGAPVTAAGSGNQAKPEPAKAKSEQTTDIYPTLPPTGSWTFHFDVDGFNYGSQDIINYYGSTASAKQGFPFGIGIESGMDLAVDPTFQVGLQAEFLKKFTENVTLDRSGTTVKEQWDASAIGPVLVMKLLIPLDESTNFILSAGGGYYVLMGAGIRTLASGVTEIADLNAGNFGGEGNASVEFFMDSARETAIDMTVGYRYARFEPLSTNVSTNINGPVNYPSPLVDMGGSNSAIDFSGPRFGLSLRYFLGKND